MWIIWVRRSFSKTNTLIPQTSSQNRNTEQTTDRREGTRERKRKYQIISSSRAQCTHVKFTKMKSLTNLCKFTMNQMGCLSSKPRYFTGFIKANVGVTAIFILIYDQCLLDGTHTMQNHFFVAMVNGKLNCECEFLCTILFFSGSW